MKAVIINRSDETGGAAIVSRRLTEALRERGVDARMLVLEKLTDSPYIEVAASPGAIRRAFLAERLGIFVANGFNRSTLFKIDNGADGLPLHRHPLVLDADVICLNWTNQGMLSLRGMQKLLGLGKPVFQTMHDLWCMTGICHHPGDCAGFQSRCGSCSLLGRKASPDDLSAKVFSRKRAIYSSAKNLQFVAVSNWLARKAAVSTLLRDMPVSVIPNAFPIEEFKLGEGSADGKFRIVTGAARLDDPIKGLPLLVEATRSLRRRYPELAARTELITFGNIRDVHALDGLAVSHTHLGRISGSEALSDVYGSAEAVLSTSYYETLPGTLIEGQACGALPIAFDSGGQSDIINHQVTGWLARLDKNDKVSSADSIADGMAWAASQPESVRPRVRESVEHRFSSRAVAENYVRKFEEALGR